MLTRSPLVKGAVPLPSTLQQRTDTPLPSSAPSGLPSSPPRPELRTDPSPAFTAWETERPPAPSTRARGTQPMLPAHDAAALATPTMPASARVPAVLFTPMPPRPAPSSNGPLIKRHAVSTPPPGFDPSKIFTPTAPALPFIPASPIVTPTAPAFAPPASAARSAQGALHAPVRVRETIRSVEIAVEDPIVDAYAPAPDTTPTVAPVAFSVIPTPIPGSYRPSLSEVDPILLAKMGPHVAERRARFTRMVKGAVAACGAVCVIAAVCLAASTDDGFSSAAPKRKPRSLVMERESLVVATAAKLLVRKPDKAERPAQRVVARQVPSRGTEAASPKGPTRVPPPRRK